MCTLRESDTFYLAFQIGNIEIANTPSNRILHGSDVLCFIGENPGFETSKPGFFCLWFYSKKKRLLGISQEPLLILGGN